MRIDGTASDGSVSNRPLRFANLWEIVICLLSGMIIPAAVFASINHFQENKLTVTPPVERLTITTRMPVKAVFRLQNLGYGAVYVRRISTGCGCTGEASATLNGPLEIHPHEQRTMVVTVAPLDGLSAVTKDITITTDEKRHPIHHVLLQIMFPPRSAARGAASAPKT